jgi:hypothetical protein
MMSFTSLTIMHSSWCTGTGVQSPINSACIFARFYMRCTAKPYHNPPYVVWIVDASLPYFFLHRHNNLLCVPFRPFVLYTTLINWPHSNPSLHRDIEQYTRLTCLLKYVDIMIIHTWRCQSTDQNIIVCRPAAIRSRRPICITIHSTASFFARSFRAIYSRRGHCDDSMAYVSPPESLFIPARWKNLTERGHYFWLQMRPHLQSK